MTQKHKDTNHQTVPFIIHNTLYLFIYAALFTKSSSSNQFIFATEALDKKGYFLENKGSERIARQGSTYTYLGGWNYNITENLQCILGAG